MKKFHDWCKKRWFLPRSFTSEKQLEKMTGVYVPFWLTNCDAKADVTALAKKERSWRQGDYRVTETKEYAVKRLAKVPYRGVPADGSQKIEDALMDAIEPFSYTYLGIKQLMAGGGVALIGTTLVPLLSGLFG